MWIQMTAKGLQAVNSQPHQYVNFGFRLCSYSAEFSRVFAQFHTRGPEADESQQESAG